MAYDFDLLVIGSGPAGQKAAIQAAKLHAASAIVEQQRHGRRRLHQHRHDPVEDAARGGPLPDRHDAAVDVRRQLPREGRRSRSTTSSSRTQSVIQRESTSSATSSPRNHVRIAERHGPFVDAAHRARRRAAPATSAPGDGRAIVIAVGTRPARPKTRRLRRAHRARLGRHPAPRRRSPTRSLVVGAGVIGIEYASMFAALGTQGDGRRGRGRSCSTSATTRSSRRCSTTCATWASSSASARRSWASSEHDERDDHAPEERQADPRRHRPLLRRPAGRDRRARPRERRARGRRARPDRGRRALPHGGRRTSTRPATSSASRAWPRRRWSRAGWPRPTPSASTSGRSPSRCRSASTRSPRSASSAAPRSS